jgi:Hg(II)-responsive transcriptional regulator
MALSELTIGRLARAAGVGVETVRFYERQRLLARPLRPERGFRTYPADAVQRIRFIRQAQALGFTLREIHELLALRADPSVDCADVLQRATVKLQDVDRKVAQLRHIRTALERLIAACPRRGSVGACSILEAMAQPLNVSGSPFRSRGAAPSLRPSQRRRKPVKTVTLQIEGMHCDGCAATIKALLDTEAGVRQAAVSYKDRQARILYDPAAAGEDRLVAAIERAGYRITGRTA